MFKLPLMIISSPTFNSYILMFTDQNQQNLLNIASFETVKPKIQNIEIQVSSSLINAPPEKLTNSSAQVFENTTF